MAERSEALAQLARMLGAEALRSAGDAEARAAAAFGFDRLAAALLDEAAASDDVTDQPAALLYLDRRLEFLGGVLGADLTARLRTALVEGVARW